MPGSPIKAYRKEQFAAFILVEDAMDQICAHLESAGNLVEFCRYYDLHYGSLSAWILADPERAKRYRAALDARSAHQKEHVIRMLMDGLETDISEIYDADGKMLPIKQWPEPLRRCVTKINGGVVETIDKARLLQMLMKVTGMDVNKVEHSGKVTLEDILEASHTPDANSDR